MFSIYKENITPKKIPKIVAEVPINQGSGNLRSLVDCNGLTLLPPNTNGNVGDIIDAFMFK